MPDCRARKQRFKETQFKTSVDTMTQHNIHKPEHKKTLFGSRFHFYDAVNDLVYCTAVTNRQKKT